LSSLRALHSSLYVFQFATLGDEHRHIVLVSRKRLWLPEAVKPAEVFASEAVLHGTPERFMGFDNYPYRISLQA
jgi:hypothetical protein